MNQPNKQNPSTAESLAQGDGVDGLVGYALDSAVAVQVMGWLPPEHPDTFAMRRKQKMTHSAYDTYFMSNLGQICTPPHYSTDIAAAMEVVEKMRGNGWSVEISSDIDYSMQEPDKEWSVGFQKRDPNAMWMVDEHGNADSLSLPEAICRAALAAHAATEREAELPARLHNHMVDLVTPRDKAER